MLSYKGTFIACAGLWLAIVSVATGEDKIELPLRDMPRGEILSASLLYHDNWYTLDRSEIACVTKALTKEPYSSPPRMLVLLPPPKNKIVLWRAEEDKLVPDDIVGFDDRVNFLHSEEKGSWYGIHDDDERAPLLALVQRIKEGTVKPLVAASPRTLQPKHTESKPEETNDGHTQNEANRK